MECASFSIRCPIWIWELIWCVCIQIYLLVRYFVIYKKLVLLICLYSDIILFLTFVCEQQWRKEKLPWERFSLPATLLKGLTEQKGWDDVLIVKKRKKMKWYISIFKENITEELTKEEEWTMFNNLENSLNQKKKN